MRSRFSAAAGLVLALLALAAAPRAWAQADALDPTFGTDGRVLAHDPDDFYDNPQTEVLFRQPDGRYVVVGGSPVRLARFNADGSADLSFGTDGWIQTDFADGAYAYSGALAPDGKIVVAGRVTVCNSSVCRYRFAVMRFLTNGTLDPSFSDDGKADVQFPNYSGSNTQAYAYAVAVMPDGKVAVGGYYRTPSGYNNWALARLTDAGVLDTTFDTDGKLTLDVSGLLGSYPGYPSEVMGLAVDNSGRLVVAGQAYDDTYQQKLVLARLTGTGGLDTSFSGDGFAVTDEMFSSSDASVAVQPDGKLVAAGRACNGPSNDYCDMGVARFEDTGALDAAFGTNGVALLDVGGPDYSNEDARAVTVDADGRIVVVGEHQNSAGYYDWVVGRLTPAGVPDPDFDLDGIVLSAWGQYGGYARGVVVEPDGRIVAAGQAADPDRSNYQSVALARYVETPAVSGIEVAFRVYVGNVYNQLPTDTFGIRGTVAPLDLATTFPLADPDGNSYWEGTVTFPVAALGEELEWKVVGMRAGSTQPAWEADPDPNNPPDGFRRLTLADDANVNVSYEGQLNDFFANRQPTPDLRFGYYDYSVQNGYTDDGLEPGEPAIGCGNGVAETTLWYKVTPEVNYTLHAEAQSYDGQAVALELFVGADVGSLTRIKCDAWVPENLGGGIAAALGLPLDAPARMDAATPLPLRGGPGRTEPQTGRIELPSGPVAHAAPTADAPATDARPSPEAIANLGASYTAIIDRKLKAGQTYYVRTSGRAYLRLNAPPDNDDGVKATPILLGRYEQTVRTQFATTQGGSKDPQAPCYSGSPDPGKTVWWTYTPVINEAFRVEGLDQYGYAPVLTAYTGAPGSFTGIGCNYGGSGYGTSTLDLNLTAGVKYYFRLFSPYEHDVTIRTSGTNDHLDDALAIAALPFVATGNTLSATAEPSERRFCDSNGKSLWWRYVPSSGGAFTFRAEDATGGHAPVVSVWRNGSSPGNHPLTLHGCGVPDGPAASVAAGVVLQTGTTYYVRVAGLGDGAVVGPFTLTVDTGAPAPLAAVALEPGLTAFPNPFTRRASLALTLAEAARVRVSVFDLLGREVARLHDGPAAIGTTALTLDGASLPSGVYVVRAEGAGVRFVQRLTLVR